MNRTRPLARIFSSPLKPSHTTTPPRLVRHIIIPPTCSTFPTTTTFNNSNNNHNHNHSHNTPRPFSTTTNKMAHSAQELIELAKARRSYYPLSKDLSITPARVQEIVKDLLDHVPSSFNSQSNRVVVLFGADHEKLWDITAEILKPMVTPEQWESTAGKMAMFKGAAGTVLFFEDQSVVNGMQEKFAIYADRFPTWALQSGAMLQFAVWTALEAEGLGANLQHYNPLVDTRIAAEWKVPADWKLEAQLVFGGKTGEAGEKQFQPMDQKFKVFGA